MPPQPQRHRDRDADRPAEKPDAPPPAPEAPEAPPLAIAPGTAPPAPTAPLPAHRSLAIARLAAEFREKSQQRAANLEEVARLNAENAALHRRLLAIPDEIRLHAFDGEPVILTQ